VPANDAATIEAVLDSCTQAQVHWITGRFLRAAIWNNATQLIRQLRHRLSSIALNWEAFELAIGLRNLPLLQELIDVPEVNRLYLPWFDWRDRHRSLLDVAITAKFVPAIDLIAARLRGDRRTVLLSAVATRDARIVEHVIQLDRALSCLLVDAAEPGGTSGRTPLLAAVAALPINRQIVAQLLALKPNLAAVDVYRRSVLHAVAQSGDCELMQQFLAMPGCPDVSVRDVDGATPLHIAMWNRDEYMMRCLLDHGVDRLAVARSHAFVDIFFAELASLEALANPFSAADFAAYAPRIDDPIRHGGFRALHVAAAAGNVPVCEQIVASGGTVDIEDDNGVTPLQVAVNSSNLLVLRCLAAAGADVNHRDRFGSTPLADFLKTKSHDGRTLEIAHELLQLGAHASDELVEYAHASRQVDLIGILADFGLERARRAAVSIRAPTPTDAEREAAPLLALLSTLFLRDWFFELLALEDLLALQRTCRLAFASVAAHLGDAEYRRQVLVNAVVNASDFSTDRARIHSLMADRRWLLIERSRHVQLRVAMTVETIFTAPPKVQDGDFPAQCHCKRPHQPASHLFVAGAELLCAEELCARKVAGAPVARCQRCSFPRPRFTVHGVLLCAACLNVRPLLALRAAPHAVVEKPSLAAIFACLSTFVAKPPPDAPRALLETARAMVGAAGAHVISLVTLGGRFMSPTVDEIFFVALGPKRGRLRWRKS
jgi:ankyrin repeat protein